MMKIVPLTFGDNLPTAATRGNGECLPFLKKEEHLNYTLSGKVQIIELMHDAMKLLKQNKMHQNAGTTGDY